MHPTAPSPLRRRQSSLQRSPQPSDCRASRALRARAPPRSTGGRRRATTPAVPSTLDPAFEIVPARHELVVVKENAELAIGARFTVAAVHEIAADRLREVAADRARCGRQRVGRADDLATTVDGIFAFDGQRDERPARNKLDELAEEWLTV